MTQKPANISVAAIVAAHGLKGEVKLKVFLDDPETLPTLPLTLATDAVKISRFKPAPRNQWIAHLSTLHNRDAADAAVGQEIFAPRTALTTASDAPLYADMIGLPVHWADGTTAGHIRSIFFNGAHDVLEIAGDSHAFMVPYAAEFVTDTPDALTLTPAAQELAEL